VRHNAYNLSLMFRGVYEYRETKGQALEKLQEWYNKLETSIEILPSFETPRQTVQLHEATILSYFNGRQTSAAAESFNAKIKNIRALCEVSERFPSSSTASRKSTAENMKTGDLAPPNLPLIRCHRNSC